MAVADHPQPTPVAGEEVDPVDPLADDVEDLGRAAAAAADELDRECRLSDVLNERAARLGLFRQLVPVELGGRGDEPLQWFRRGVGLARHEPSIAWVVTQGAAELGWIASGGEGQWAREVLADPMASSASTVAGIGTLRLADGRAVLAGRWGFDTGSDHATWRGGLALVDGSDVEAGATRMCWVPADRAHVLGDWDAIGLRGTGSHTLVIDEQDIDPVWTFDPWSATSNDRGPYRCLVGNGNWPIATAVAATQLGNARRCLDEGRRLAVTKSPSPTFVPLATNAAVQRRLTELEGAWMAASASVEHELAALWSEARRFGQLSSERRWRLATANVHANRVAVGIVDGVVEITGTAVVDRHAVIARSLCDARALAGHISTSGYVHEQAARISLGLVDEDRLV